MDGGVGALLFTLPNQQTIHPLELSPSHEAFVPVTSHLAGGCQEGGVAAIQFPIRLVLHRQ